MSYETQIGQTAARYGVPPDLALALARRESSLEHYNANGSVKRGAAGEFGLYQLMPATARELGVNPADPLQNIEGGLRYLRQQFDRFGDWSLALAAYNAGAGRVAKNQIPSSTKLYVSDIWGMLAPPAIAPGTPDVEQVLADMGEAGGVPTFSVTTWAPAPGGSDWMLYAVLFLAAAGVAMATSD